MWGRKSTRRKPIIENAKEKGCLLLVTTPTSFQSSSEFIAFIKKDNICSLVGNGLSFEEVRGVYEELGKFLKLNEKELRGI